jgi:hypothetical protein
VRKALRCSEVISSVPIGRAMSRILLHGHYLCTSI